MNGACMRRVRREFACSQSPTKRPFPVSDSVTSAACPRSGRTRPSPWSETRSLDDASRVGLEQERNDEQRLRLERRL
jgi:hypothetical protein